MKKLLNILLFFSCCVSGCYTSGQVPADNNYSYNEGGVNYQTFYDQLQPYGNWIDYPGYGYVWQPSLGADFRPYETNGHWVSTVDGWAWASDYDWGWAPFHYGRWLYEPSIGWAWVPGYEWAPAWVTWGQYEDVYAWAPLAPGISISIGSSWRAPYNYWCFIPRTYIGYSNPARYVVRNRFNQTAVNNITIINNYNSYNNRQYYHRGPDYREVERYTHHTITPLQIASAQRPGIERVSQRQFQVYRPAVAATSGNNRSYAPSRVRTLGEVSRPGDARRSGVADENKRGDAFSQGNDQNNRNSRPGNHRDRTSNNGANNDTNIPNEAQLNIDQRSATPGNFRGFERNGGFRQDNVQNNPAQTPVPNQQLPPDDHDRRIPPVRRYQGDVPRSTTNNTGGAVGVPQQAPQSGEPYGQRHRYQQMPERGQGRPVYQNNGNMPGSQTVPQQNSGGFRGQRSFPSQPSGTVPNRPVFQNRPPAQPQGNTGEQGNRPHRQGH